MDASPAQPAAAGPGAFACRELGAIRELEACEELQRRAFGYADIDVVGTNELRSIQKAGGLVLGAFVPSEPGPVGFCFGLVGRDHHSGELYHASRMVAVLPAFRRSGIAQGLKLAQREAVLAQGLRRMRWTFDPLRLGNARLNLVRLGTWGRAYHRAFFGEATSSPLHLGIGTDRLEVEWDLARPPGAHHSPAELAALPGRVQLPLDVGFLQAERPEQAVRWRERVREGLEAAFARGEAVVGLLVDERGAPHYVLGTPP